VEVDSSWNVMAHGDAREGKWRGNWRMEWVASNLHTTSEHVVSSITTAGAHTSAASSRLNWSPCRFKWTRPFHRKTKSGFCTCAITFQTRSPPSFISFGSRWRRAVSITTWPIYPHREGPQYPLDWRGAAQRSGSSSVTKRTELSRGQSWWDNRINYVYFCTQV
jgi:hypothetical protein